MEIMVIKRMTSIVSEGLTMSYTTSPFLLNPSPNSKNANPTSAQKSISEGRYSVSIQYREI